MPEELIKSYLIRVKILPLRGRNAPSLFPPELCFFLTEHQIGCYCCWQRKCLHELAVGPVGLIMEGSKMGFAKNQKGAALGAVAVLVFFTASCATKKWVQTKIAEPMEAKVGKVDKKVDTNK